MAHGLDGNAVTAKASDHLDYVSQLANRLGVDDPVELFLAPLVGRWTDLHDEAARWRTAAKTAEDVTHRLTTPLGGLDAAWQGKDADSFLEYMRQAGLAGNDMSDAMNAMAEALDKTADSIRQIVQEMVDLLTDTAEQSSDAMTVPVAGESRAKGHLQDVSEPTEQLHDAVKDVLSAFTKLCRGVQGGQPFAGVTMRHKMPEQNWSPPKEEVARPVPQPTPAPKPTPAPTHVPAPTHTPTPTHTSASTQATHAASQSAAHHVPAAAAHASMPTGGGGGGGGAGGVSALVGHAANLGSSAQQSGPPPLSGAVADDPTTGSISGQLPTTGGAAGAGTAAAGQQQGGTPMGMGGMGGMRGGQGGGDQEHKAKTRISGDVKDIFGKPDRTAPPTIGGN